MQDKRIALVTGANQLVGLQVAREPVASGLTVLVSGLAISSAARPPPGKLSSRYRNSK
ncbi:MAG TPA: hypothetical protein VK752_08330 [Bryobacteraceae bacterium]|jgi:hypothetical protein|nr:hypothetical protein [Bryobacteraceae bacterium]